MKNNNYKIFEAWISNLQCRNQTRVGNCSVASVISHLINRGIVLDSNYQPRYYMDNCHNRDFAIRYKLVFWYNTLSFIHENGKSRFKEKFTGNIKSYYNLLIFFKKCEFKVRVMLRVLLLTKLYVVLCIKIFYKSGKEYNKADKDLKLLIKLLAVTTSVDDKKDFEQLYKTANKEAQEINDKEEISFLTQRGVNRLSDYVFCKISNNDTSSLKHKSLFIKKIIEMVLGSDDWLKNNWCHNIETMYNIDLKSGYEIKTNLFHIYLHRYIKSIEESGNVFE